MKQLLLAVLLLSTGAFSAQLQPTDPRLAQEPAADAASTKPSVATYKSWSGLDIQESAMRYDAQIRQQKTLAQRAQRTVDAMVKLGVYALEHNGRVDRARYWESSYGAVRAEMFNQLASFAVGDHGPWSAWLEAFYNDLKALLPPSVITQFHLDDIWYFNWTVTVVFNPVMGWDIDEYRLHFIEFGGLTSYWISYWACFAATISSGAIGFICEPIGSMVEKVARWWVLPDLSDYVWHRWNDGPH